MRRSNKLERLTLEEISIGVSSLRVRHGTGLTRWSADLSWCTALLAFNKTMIEFFLRVKRCWFLCQSINCGTRKIYKIEQRSIKISSKRTAETDYQMITSLNRPSGRPGPGFYKYFNGSYL